MPYIYKPANRKRKEIDKTERQKLRTKLYNNGKWRKLRTGYLIEHPICEICGKELATDIHHLNSPFADNLTDLERTFLLLDPNNVQALCKKCHGKLHASCTKVHLIS